MAYAIIESKSGRGNITRKYWGILILLATGVILFCLPKFLRADVVRGEIFSIKQPDGSRVEVKIWGDEFYQRVESLDGYTLIRNRQTQWICYAQLSYDESDFIATDIIYRGTNVEGLNLGEQAEVLSRGEGLKLRVEAIREKVKQAKMELYGVTDESQLIAAMEQEVQYSVELTGSVLGLTLLIDFPDVPNTIGRGEIENYTNQAGYTGYSNNGSVRDYFYDVSNNLLTYTNYVTEYYTAQHNKAYYTDPAIPYGTRAKELIHEALAWLDGPGQGFDFSTLSTNSSGTIRAINAFYAGARDNAWAEGLWPHKWTLSPVFYADGVKSGSYQITNIGTSLGLSTFCHENGHMLFGWPDLYDYDHDSRGIGRFGIMCNSGSITNPIPPCAYMRMKAGWETIIEINSMPSGTHLIQQANSFTTYRYSHPTDSREYFLIESRQRTGRNTYLADSGLIIWHVDEDGSNDDQQMTPSEHYKVSVEQADGLFHLENNVNSGGSGDLFHGGYVDSFDDYTLPDARWWAGNESGLNINKISPEGATMDFYLGFGTIIVLSATEFNFTANEGADNPGDQILTIGNDGIEALNWQINESCPWLEVNPSSGAATLTEPNEVTLSVDISGLDEGDYNCEFTVSDPDAINSPQTVQVNLNVIGPIIETSATEFEFTVFEGGDNPDDQILVIRNGGGSLLNWKIDEDCSWLEIDPNSGSSAIGDPNEYVTIQVDITGLNWGDYNCELTITDPCAFNSPQTVQVILHVVGPIIELSGTEFDFIAQKGGADPGDQILFIGNVGGGTLEWRLEEDCDWLAVDPESGIADSEPNEVMLKVDISGLSEGVYDGELTIIDPCAVNSPQTVGVNLHVYIAGELHVPAEYPTIQAAIDAAAVGDTVIVEPATYNENIDFKGKNITVTSTNPYDGAVMAGTVIDGGGTASVVTFAGSEEPNCVLIGFTITGGFTTGDGGGIKGKGTLATISRCLIIDNATASDGGGLSRCNGLISECVISGNVSQKGGGLADCGGTIISCLISDNHASNYGGGLHNCNGYIASCTVAGNDADISGVLNYCGGEFTNCIIWGNTPATIRNCTAGFSFSCLEWVDVGMGNINADPNYADAANGDYHLCSQAGRWEPGSQLWVYDAFTSLGIDTGNPGCSLGDEPADNNLRRNMGVYGGTAQAGKSPAVWGLLADVNNDGWVNLEDFAYQTSNWLMSENEQPGDLNRDGVINISDLLLLWADWLEETVWY